MKNGQSRKQWTKFDKVDEIGKMDKIGKNGQYGEKWTKLENWTKLETLDLEAKLVDIILHTMDIKVCSLFTEFSE